MVMFFVIIIFFMLKLPDFFIVLSSFSLEC